MPDDIPAPPDLDAIRDQLQEIVPPPWYAVDDEDGRIFIRSETTQEDVVSVMYYWESAEFIAAAPTNIAALLAEVERLRAENRGLHYIVAVTRGYKAEAGDYPPTESWRGMTLHITDPKPPAED